MKNVFRLLVLSLVVFIACDKEEDDITDTYGGNTNEETDTSQVDTVLTDTTLVDTVLIDTTTLIIDGDGNVYEPIKIGNQYWLTENLKTTSYSNGDLIELIENDGIWSNTNQGYFCYYNNNQSYSDDFGNLYNWLVIEDDRNVCPIGWHVPTESDWNELDYYISINANNGASSLKSILGWSDGTDDFGFKALPSGYRNNQGTFLTLNSTGVWWSSTEENGSEAKYRHIYDNDESFYEVTRSKSYGFSIRCIKD